MDKKKRKKETREPVLARAQRALERRFAVNLQGNVLFVGSDAVVVSRPRVRRLGVRFWSGADAAFRAGLLKALKEAMVDTEQGEDFELEHKGHPVKPEAAIQALGETKRPKRGTKARKGGTEAPKDETNVDSCETEDVTFSTLARNPHVRRCLMCKELIDMVASADDEYVERAVAAIEAHEKEEPEPANIACRYAGCVHHEDVDRKLARKMIELGHGDDPWRDVRDVKVSNIALLVKEGDAPEGWDFKAQESDVMRRHFVELPRSAGDIYVRLGPKRTTLHVWISPAYATRHETVEDVATLENVVAECKRIVPALKAWCMKKFSDLKALAEMDLGLEEAEK